MSKQAERAIRRFVREMGPADREVAAHIEERVRKLLATVASEG